MAGRLNLRPIYDPNELTGGERISRGIGAALGEYAQHQEAGRQDESRRRAAGQVMTTQGEGGIDRLRSLGRRLIGRGQPDVTPNVLAPPPDWNGRPAAPTSRIIPASGIVDETQPPDRPVFSPRSPSPAPALAQTPNRAVATPPVIPAGPAPAGRSAPRTIGSALDAYTEQDAHGNTWTIDPNRDANRKLATDQAELSMKDDMSNKNDEDKIAALMSAGMPAGEARARVLNNVVKYDTEFGIQQKPNTAMTFDQRRTLSQEHDAREASIRERLAKLSAAGRQNGPEALELRRQALDLSRERLDMQRTQGEDRARGADVGRETTIGNAINSTLTKDPIAQSTMTPEQRTAEAKRAKERDTHLGNAASEAARLKNSHASADQARARAQALRAAGKTPEQIRAAMTSEGYRIH